MRRQFRNLPRSPCSGSVFPAWPRGGGGSGSPEFLVVVGRDEPARAAAPIACWPVPRRREWPTDVPLNSVAIAFGFAAATGVFFGFYPARKAAALDPIEALRFE